jgi:hypothetical protein
MGNASGGRKSANRHTVEGMLPQGVSPEHRLWLAVVERAVDDARLFVDGDGDEQCSRLRGNGSSRGVEAREVFGWWWGKECEEVCALAGVEASYLRQLMVQEGWLPLMDGWDRGEG